MKFLNLLNSVILKANNSGQTHYFFVDAGVPISFSNTLTNLTNKDLGINYEFNLPLHSSIPMMPISFDKLFNSLYELFGIKISGFLGLDFFKCFKNVEIDFNGQEINFNIDSSQYSHSANFLNSFDFPLYINAVINNVEQQCIVDTGALFTIVLNDNMVSQCETSSNSWLNPYVSGEMTVNYYPNLTVCIDNDLCNDITVAYPQQILPVPCDCVLGLSLLVNYRCLFDVENDCLRFKKSNKTSVVNLSPLYTLGFQVKFKNEKLVVSNLLRGYDVNVEIGDEIEIPDVDMTKKDVVNDIYNKILFIKSDKDVKLLCNGKEIICKPQKFFR